MVVNSLPFFFHKKIAPFTNINLLIKLSLKLSLYFLHSLYFIQIIYGRQQIKKRLPYQFQNIDGTVCNILNPSNFYILSFEYIEQKLSLFVPWKRNIFLQFHAVSVIFLWNKIHVENLNLMVETYLKRIGHRLLFIHLTSYSPSHVSA